MFRVSRTGYRERAAIGAELSGSATIPGRRMSHGNYRLVTGDRSLRAVVDVERGMVGREVYVNEAIYQQELEQIFARAWLFIGH